MVGSKAEARAGHEVRRQIRAISMSGTPILGWDEQIEGGARSGCPRCSLGWPEWPDPAVNSAAGGFVGMRRESVELMREKVPKIELKLS